MADPIAQFVQQLNAIPGFKARSRGNSIECSFSFNDEPRIALKELILMQSRLRVIKKEVGSVISAVRAKYRGAISSATYTPGLGGALLGAKYRAASRRDGAVKKQRLAQERDRQLAPYEAVKRVIDQFIVQLDQKKIEIQARASR